MNQDRPPTTERRQIALIHSVVAFADRREPSDVLADVRDILDGADIAELSLRRAVR